MDERLSVLSWLIVELLLIGTGRRVIRTASLGKWRGEQFGGTEGRVHLAAGSLSFVLDGQRVVTRTGLLFLGIAFYVVLGISLVLMAR